MTIENELNLKDLTTETSFSIGRKLDYSIDYLKKKLADFHLGVSEDELSTYHELRQVEFLLGRYLYRKILKEKYAKNVFELGRESSRMPVALDGFCLSITHDTEYVIVAVSKSLKSVGIDLEKIGRIKPQMESTILSENDNISALIEMSSLSHEAVMALIFSAKESLYKLIFPCIRSYFGFSAAYLKSINTEDQSFEIVLNNYLENPDKEKAFEKGDRFKGKFSILNDRVFTCLEL